MKVLITGAGGFIGTNLIQRLNKSSISYLGTDIGNFTTDFNLSKLDVLDSNDFKLIIGCETIVYLAAIAHTYTADKKLLEETNWFGIVKFVEYAAQNGLKKFIFVSTIGVEYDKENFHEKLMAERELLRLSEMLSFELQILRSPLLYGEGVKGNILTLLKLSNSKILLPFGGLDHQRNMMNVNNLVDLIIKVIEGLKLDAPILSVSDGTLVTYSDLVTIFREKIGRPTRLVNVSPKILLILGFLVGKRKTMQRFLAHNQSSIEIPMLENWSAPYSKENGMSAMVNHFLKDLEK